MLDLHCLPSTVKAGLDTSNMIRKSLTIAVNLLSTYSECQPTQCNEFKTSAANLRQAGTKPQGAHAKAAYQRQQPLAENLCVK